MFDSLYKMCNNVLKLDESNIFITVVSKEGVKDFVVDLNLGQLIEGRGSDNRSLPRYVDDPYFKTVQQAKAYEAWKSSISPSKTKPKGVMDFYINGRFHSTIKADAKGDSLDIYSNSNIYDSVNNKTKGKALGLDSISSEKLSDKILSPYIEEVIKRLFNGI